MKLIKRRCWNIGAVFSLIYNVSLPLNMTLMLLQRQILAEVARFFDHLSLYLPVLLHGWIRLSELWGKGLRWDEQFLQEFSSRWKSLSSDPFEFGTISFTQKAFRLATCSFLWFITGSIWVHCQCRADLPILRDFCQGGTLEKKNSSYLGTFGSVLCSEMLVHCLEGLWGIHTNHNTYLLGSLLVHY